MLNTLKKKRKQNDVFHHNKPNQNENTTLKQPISRNTKNPWITEPRENQQRVPVLLRIMGRMYCDRYTGFRELKLIAAPLNFRGNEFALTSSLAPRDLTRIFGRVLLMVRASTFTTDNGWAITTRRRSLLSDARQECAFRSQESTVLSRAGPVRGKAHPAHTYRIGLTLAAGAPFADGTGRCGARWLRIVLLAPEGLQKRPKERGQWVNCAHRKRKMKNYHGSRHST